MCVLLQKSWLPVLFIALLAGCGEVSRGDDARLPDSMVDMKVVVDMKVIDLAVLDGPDATADLLTQDSMIPDQGTPAKPVLLSNRRLAKSCRRWPARWPCSTLLNVGLNEAAGQSDGVDSMRISGRMNWHRTRSGREAWRQGA